MSNKPLIEDNKKWDVYLDSKHIRKLDLKDLKIITLLMNNARLSLSNIQKITRLSKPAILNRIERLKKDGIFIGEPTTFIDFLPLGVEGYNIEIQTGMTILEKEEYILYLKKNGFITNISTITGRKFDILIRVLDTGNYIDRIIEYLSKGIKDLRVYQVKSMHVQKQTNLFQLDLNTTLKKPDSSYSNLFSHKKKSLQKIDKKDIDILLYLAQNPCESIVELSEKLELAKDTVKSKIKKLIEAKVIRMFFQGYNPYKLGFTTYLLKLKIFERTRDKEVIEFLNSLQIGTGVMKQVEEWNIIAVLFFNNRTQLANFEKDLMHRFEDIIIDYEIHIYDEQPHYDLFPQEVYKELRKRFD